MSKKEPTGKEMIDEAKRKVKEQKKAEKETKMKSFLRKIKTPLTVLLTLLAVFAAYAFYQWSFEQGVQSQKSITQQVEEQVAAQLKTSD